MPKLLSAVLLAGGMLALTGCVYEEHHGGGDRGHKHENHHYKPDKPHESHKPHQRPDRHDYKDRDYRRSRQG